MASRQSSMMKVR